MKSGIKSISKREKMMLLIIAIIALPLLTVQFFIRPMNTKLQEKNSEYQALVAEQGKIQALLGSAKSVMNSFDLAQQQYSEIRTLFPPESLNNEIGRLLTTLCEEHGFRPIGQNLHNPVVYFLVDGNKKTTTEFSTISAVMTVSGTYDDLKDLIDTVGETENIRIKNVTFRMKGNPPASAGQTDIIGSAALDRISITFEVTMLKARDSGI